MGNFETATKENFACSKKRGGNISTMHGVWSEQEMNKTLQRDNKVQTDEHLKRQTNSQTVWRITWRCNIRVVFCDKTAAVRRMFKDKPNLKVHQHCYQRGVTFIIAYPSSNNYRTDWDEMLHECIQYIAYPFDMYRPNNLLIFLAVQDRSRLCYTYKQFF